MSLNNQIPLPTAEVLAEDLSIANMEGTGRFQYGLLDGRLVGVTYDDSGEIVAAFELDVVARSVELTEDITHAVERNGMG
ncbi:hypothetical protein EDF62_3291 [Leucobacter luti]|uniref:Uncharacterized protein n=1 Tax=Leucobacter luti TaxID=340320 RepID=A0A4R6RTF6_9MICO|nr:hypothetical protein [Leucobacter luti]TDP89555.1 hypothetical protein EDF62_3291 [Leucobacter luti]